MNKLTIKQKKFVANKISGKTNATSYVEAGYKATTKEVANANASKLLQKHSIQSAIDDALKYHEATPEFAVGRLKAIAEQSKELGASRLASKDILELHGYNRGNQPNITLDIQNAFFKNSRTE